MQGKCGEVYLVTYDYYVLCIRLCWYGVKVNRIKLLSMRVTIGAAVVKEFKLFFLRSPYDNSARIVPQMSTLLKGPTKIMKGIMSKQFNKQIVFF